MDTTDEVEKRLLENELDAAIVAGVVRSRFIALTPLFTEQHVALCAPGHPMAGRSVTLAQFMAQPLVLRQRGSGAFQLFSAAAAVLDAGQLAVIRVQGLDVHSTVCLAVHKSKFLSPALGHFMDMARALAQPQTGE